MLKNLYKEHGVQDVVLLAVLWITAVVIVNPIGNFPLNDDFSYSKTVLTILKDGNYNPTQWPGMTLLIHALWGTLFCLIFGFSFSTLRVSIILLGLVGVIVQYFIFRTIRAPRYVSFIAAILLAFNPIYFTLSNTYMTDVTFTTLSLVAILFFIRQMQTDTNSSWTFFCIFSIAAILCRQFGLFIPFAYGIAHSYRYGFSRRSNIRGWTPFLLTSAVLLIYQGWLHAQGIVPAYIPMLKALATHPLLWRLQFLSKNTFYFILYSGLFSFPFLIIFLTNWNKAISKRAVIIRSIFCFIILLVLVYLIRHNRFMPLGYNILTYWGIGPSNLRDTDILFLPHLQNVSWRFWKLVTIISVVGGGFLLWTMGSLSKRLLNLFRKTPTDSRTALLIFIYVNIVFYVLIMSWSNFFDRYVLPIIPLCTLIIFLCWGLVDFHSKTVKKAAVVASLILCLFSGLFSIAGARDYLTYNRVRWRMLRTCIDEKSIPPAKIDGGFEFNGWYLYDDHYQLKKDKSWWWVADDEYVISMSPLAGYDEIERNEFFRWLTRRRDSIYLLHRSSPR